MKDKNGNKRKISFKYICWLIGSVIMLTVFFLILVFEYRIFDKYETAEIVKINGYSEADRTFTSGENEITFLVDGKEFSTYFLHPVASFPIYLKVGDKIQYLAEDPNKIFPDRIKGIVILSCAEAVIVAIFMGATIYEIKKGM